MKRTRNPEEKRQKILEATHKILREGGYFTNFSLDNVAKTAEISKGGRIHHFPSKVALVKAAAQEASERFEQRFAENLAADGGGENGRLTRTYIHTGFDSIAAGGEMSPLLLAYLHDAAEPQTRFEAWQQQLANDGIDPVMAAIIRLAVDGLIYTELIDYVSIEGDLRHQILSQLLELAREADQQK